MPEIDQSVFASAAAWLTAAVPNALAALALAVGGFWLSRLAERTMLRVMDRQTAADPTLRGVLGSSVRYAVLLLFVIAAVGQLGFQMSSILAVLATAGLAVGLALQATLANIAAGIMLLWLRPFRVGDSIEAGGIAGRIVEVGLFACEMHTADGVYQFVPNSELWNKKLTNYSRLPRRLVAVRVTVADAAGLERLRGWVAGEAGRNTLLLAEPAPAVVVNEIAADKVVATVQAWVATENHQRAIASLADRLPPVVLRGSNLE